MFTRALIVLLLVLNLGVAAWWWLRPPAPEPPAASHPVDVPKLQLLGEGARPRASPAPAMPPAPASGAEASAVGAPAQSAAPEARCYVFGPFADQSAVDAARVGLQIAAMELTQRSEVRRASGAWNVLLPPLADRAAAQAMAQRIDAAGFKDYYVIAQGVGANGIALGRFGSEESARRHLGALQAAGFPAQLQAPVGAGTRYWLDARTTTALDPNVVRGGLSPAQVQPVDCGTLG